MHAWVSEFCTYIGGVHTLKTGLIRIFLLRMDLFEGFKQWERIRSFLKVFEVKVFQCHEAKDHVVWGKPLTEENILSCSEKLPIVKVHHSTRHKESPVKIKNGNLELLGGTVKMIVLQNQLGIFNYGHLEIGINLMEEPLLPTLSFTRPPPCMLSAVCSQTTVLVFTIKQMNFVIGGRQDPSGFQSSCCPGHRLQVFVLVVSPSVDDCSVLKDGVRNHIVPVGVVWKTASHMACGEQVPLSANAV